MYKCVVLFFCGCSVDRSGCRDVGKCVHLHMLQQPPPECVSKSSGMAMLVDKIMCVCVVLLCSPDVMCAACLHALAASYVRLPAVARCFLCVTNRRWLPPSSPHQARSPARPPLQQQLGVVGQTAGAGKVAAAVTTTTSCLTGEAVVCVEMLLCWRVVLLRCHVPWCVSKRCLFLLQPAVSCHIMSCCAMPCHAMSCCAVLCCGQHTPPHQVVIWAAAAC